MFQFRRSDSHSPPSADRYGGSRHGQMGNMRQRLGGYEPSTRASKRKNRTDKEKDVKMSDQIEGAFTFDQSTNTLFNTDTVHYDQNHKWYK